MNQKGPGEDRTSLFRLTVVQVPQRFASINSLKAFRDEFRAADVTSGAGLDALQGAIVPALLLLPVPDATDDA
jgi:hypothetical protein